MTQTKHFILICLCISIAHSLFDILKFGAIANSDNVKDHFQNQKAIQAAIEAASQSQSQRVVRIPAKTFYSMPIKIQNANNITFEILGRLAASKNVKYWTKDENKRNLNFMQFTNCTNIQMGGGGKIDGRGYHWWMLLFLNDKKYLNNTSRRPHLIEMDNCRFVTIHDLILKNSPNFHVKLSGCHDVQVYNVNILVNTTAQINLLKRFSLQGAIVMFPFNTDGIDPSGSRFNIYNITVQNFDDVVVPKPSPQINCTRDIWVENAYVVLGVGMSIGSVPPHIDGRCIRNVTFKNVYMKRPFKGIYLKSNPGNQGYGIVQDIYYKNFTMDRPIWWAIYLGPQQMKEPNGNGPGCMLYPYDPKGTCSTQPRVTFKNITLEDVTIHKSLLYPVIIRCNVSNPCTEINFINVNTDKWIIGQKQTGYVCEYASGKGINNSPPIHCLNQSYQSKGQVVNSEAHNHIETELDHQTKQDLIFSVQSYLQQIRHSKSISELYKEMMAFVRKGNKLWILEKIVQQIQVAALQVGYHQEDDEFTYDINQIKLELQQELEITAEY